MYIVTPLVNFFNAFKLVVIINENHLKELCVLMLSFIMQAMLQGNGGQFLSHTYPKEVWLSKYNHVAYLHSLNLL